MRGFQLCADFTIFESEVIFTRDFMLSGFDFSKVDGSSRVRIFSSEGLKIEDGEIKIALPIPTTTVYLKLKEGTGSTIKVEALDSSDAVVRSKTISGSSVNLRLSASEIAVVNITSDGSESFLEQVCIVVCCH